MGGGLSKKKVKSIALAKDRSGNLETWTHRESGTVYYSTVVTFEDGKVGTYKHKGKTQDFFIVGQEVEFEAKNMGTWFRLLKPKKKWDKHPGGWVPKSPAEIKRDNVSFAAGYVKDLIASDKVDLKDFGKVLRQFMGAISAEIDKIED